MNNGPTPPGLPAGVSSWKDLYFGLREHGLSHEDAVRTIETRQGARPAAEPVPSGVEIERPGRLRSAIATGVQGATFGFGDEIGAAIRAAPRLLPGGQSFGESYDENVDAARQGIAAAREDFPGQSIATEIAGAAVPLIATGGAAAPASGATTGARALGAVGRLAQAPIRGGALAGGLYGAGASEGGVEERLTGGAVGAATGGAAGGLLAGAGRVLRPVVSRAVDMVRPQLSRAQGAVGQVVDRLGIGTVRDRAVGALTAAMERAGIKPDDLSRLAAEARPGETIMDVAARTDNPARGALTRMVAGGALGAGAAAVADPGDSPIASTVGAVAGAGLSRRLPGNAVARLGRAAQSIPSRGSQQIDDFLAERSAGAGPRIQESVQSRTGRSLTGALEQVDELTTQARRTAGPLYDEAYQHTVDTPGVRQMAELPEFQRAYREAQDVARIEGDALPDLPDFAALREMGADPAKAEFAGIPVKGLDYMKRYLDQIIESGSDASGSLDRTRARALRNRLSKVLEEVDEAVPSFGQARAAFRGPTRQAELIQIGREGGEIRGQRLKPFLNENEEVLERFVSTLSPEERSAYLSGAMDDVRQMLTSVSTGRDAAAALTRREAPAVVRRLRLLFDDDASFDAFLEDLSSERGMAGVANFVRGGSPTARIQAEQADLMASPFSVASLSRPREAVQRMAEEFGVNRLRGLTEATVDELAPLLTTPLDQGGADLIQQAIAEMLRREAAGAPARALLPRAAGAGAGAAAGGQFGRERR